MMKVSEKVERKKPTKNNPTEIKGISVVSRRDQHSAIGSRLDEHRASQVQQRIMLDETTLTDLQRYEQFALNITASGLIQSTIYHIR
jgi:hypothetical protein